ncbi:VPA1269 family protein [Vibrio lentus]|uniref:Integrase n=1 Tax=Vibrio lentus TaxID=136468 RepID=A0AB36XS98_9VIBR|nr:VPA1269 family protein [Vibrio lentus]MCC4836773.1 hypothetical protein [Vibrio lentus]PMI16403.1 hypothetical protein BCU51_03165 [Vibrio lentus]PMK35407.1 hypothetical protein BCU02_13510 [Vibrio lentus]PMK49943.1 hypothetical protein BCT99_00590 [Vibrio lentus]PML31620.1 hypothetical protein BCT79_04390 [Vibrio lentus]
MNKYTLSELRSTIEEKMSERGKSAESIINLSKEYLSMRKQDLRMPISPETTYAKKGFKSYRDLFGLPDIDLYTFKELKESIQKKLSVNGKDTESITGSVKQYRTMRKADPRMPFSPHREYASKGFKSYRDLFGLPELEYYTFKELKKSIKTKLTKDDKNAKKVTRLVEEYQSMRKQDPRMPSSPHSVYASEGFISYRNLFELPDDNLYTLKELKSVIKENILKVGKELGSISSYSNEYKKMRKNDLRIPSTPEIYYASKGFKSYRDLFGVSNLYTYKEIKIVIQNKLVQERIDPQKINKYLDTYNKMRDNDPCMPASPNSTYKSKGFKSYRDLFGVETPELYTRRELKIAIKKYLVQHGKKAESISSLSREYQLIRKQDPRIPSSTQAFVARKFKDYRELFGLPELKFYTLIELKTAIKEDLDKRKIDIASISNYSELYRKLREHNPRMPFTPRTTYASKGFKSYRDLFGLKEIKTYSYHEAQNAIQEYLIHKKVDIEKVVLTRIYREITLQDDKLPDYPDRVYSEVWMGFEYYFQRKTFYPFKKAHDIAKSKGISKSAKQVYERLRLEDPMFPPSPYKAYPSDWRTFDHFFGINNGHYKTLQDAQAAAINIAEKIEIKITCRSYPEITKYDNRLPRSIDRYQPYEHDWQGWKEFAGSKKYEIESARNVALDHEWNSFKDYEKEHHIDLKMPAEPVKYYGLNSYSEFIKFKYWDCSEVKKYCAENKVTTISEYQKHARKVIHLKVRHSKIDGVTKAADFLYVPRPFEDIESLGFSLWAQLARQFLITHAKRGMQSKKVNLNIFLKHLISKNSLPDEPFKLFIEGERIEPLERLIEMNSNRGKYLESTIIEFIQFVMYECCYDRDEDTGELITTDPNIHFRHPYQHLNVEIESRARHIETVKPPLDFVFIEAAKQYLIPNFVKNAIGIKQPCTTFSELTNAHELFEADWFEVDEEVYRQAKSDPCCATKTVMLDRSGVSGKIKVYKIWSPVRAIAMYVLFSLPLRGVQICYLDSGEADEFKLVEQGGNLKWVINDNPLSGQLDAKGFLKRLNGDAIGMNVSTNKTSKKEGGYTVPWMPDDLARWVIKLRDWQSRYNPLSEPTPWSDIHMSTIFHEKVLRMRGRQCFLFRDVRNLVKRKKNPAGSQPFIPNSMFNVFEKLLFTIQTDEMPLAKIILGKNGGSLSDYESTYTPHGLRVSHISALLFEGDGIDPIIVQKLVGHANLVMTIYYGVISHEHMREKLSGQYKTIVANKQKQYQASLLSRNIEDAKGELIYLSDGAGQVTWESSAIRFKDAGMCPVANGRCDVGESPVDLDAKVLTYGRAKSCYQCRFFVTGPAFLGGLLAKFNEVNVARKRASERIEKLQKKEKETRLKKKEAEDHQRENEMFRLELEQIRTAIDTEKVKFYEIGADQAAIYRKVTQCIQKMNKDVDADDKTEGMTLILNRNKAEVSVSLDESSDFRMLAEVCEDAQIYDSIDDSEAVIRREKFLDSMLKNNGFDAMFFNLDEDQSRYVGNQMQQLLKKRLSGWGGVEKLIYGEVRLSDISSGNKDNMQIIERGLSLIINDATAATVTKVERF